MLPRDLEIENIDPEIRNLVRNMNRIPKVNTLTTCQSHVFDSKDFPTKNGFINFSMPLKEHKSLLRKIRKFCRSLDFFKLEYFGYFGGPSLIYTIKAYYESYPNDTTNHGKAKMREREILHGWHDLNEVIKEYIKKNISEDIDSLAYRE